MEQRPQVGVAGRDEIPILGLDDLLARARGGNEEAGVELLRRHQPLIRAIVFRRYGIAGADMEEIAQTVAVRFFRHLPRIGCVAGFLAAVTASACLQHLRNRATEQRARARYGLELAAARREGRGGPEEAAIIGRLDAVTLLERIGPRCARLLRATVLHGRTHSEYARESGMPLGSVGPTVGRCLEKMRRMLKVPGAGAGR